MLSAAVASLVGLLFLLVFTSLRYGLSAWRDGQARKRKLHAYRDSVWNQALAREMARFGKPYRHISDLLLALGWRMNPDGFVLASLMLAFLGAASGVLLFQSLRAIVMLMFIMGGLPYLLLRMKLVNRQLAARLEFLPAVELYYQSYLVTGCRHVRTALRKTIEERRLTGEVQVIFEQLYRSLSLQGDDEGSLRRFSLSFGSVWADYFCSIVKVSLEEGNNVAGNLKELIADMRKAQLANQIERHRLLEIRLANFTPVLFLALFLGVNFRLNPEGSYLYYVLDPAGRSMLLNAVILFFGSMLMGIYLSRRKL